MSEIVITILGLQVVALGTIIGSTLITARILSTLQDLLAQAKLMSKRRALLFLIKLQEQ